eukprot:SAG31_NODE_8391_length_1460_cov_1.445996_2_plen_358_part_01
MEVHNSIRYLRCQAKHELLANETLSVKHEWTAPPAPPPEPSDEPWCLVPPMPTSALTLIEPHLHDENGQEAESLQQENSGLTPETTRMRLTDDTLAQHCAVCCSDGVAAAQTAEVSAVKIKPNQMHQKHMSKRRKRALDEIASADVRSQDVAALEVNGANGAVADPIAGALEPGELDARRTLSHAHVRCVAIVGGSHGNESNGIALAKHFQDQPGVVSRPSFETIVEIGNPAAVAANQRYIETDLNRCFLAETLADTTSKHHSTLEHRRARELDALLGPKRSVEPRADFVIGECADCVRALGQRSTVSQCPFHLAKWQLCFELDLHNTTAETGVALMMAPSDDFAHEVAHYLMQLDES